MEKFSSQEEFLNYIIPYARRACKRMWLETGLDHPLVWASVVVAQCCHENGYGMDPKCYCLNVANNYVGIKAELLNKSWVPEYSVWQGKSINKLTPEVYNNTPVSIHDDFRVYEDSPERGIMDYLLFLRFAGYQKGFPKYYNDLKNLSDPFDQIRLIHQKGYATGVAYSERIIEKIVRHDLITRCDKGLKDVEPSKFWPVGLPSVLDKEGGEKMATLNIKKNFLTGNRCYQQAVKRTAIGIQIHSIGTGQNTAKAVADYWNQSSIKACVTYVADAEVDGLVLQLLPEDYYSWADAGWGNKNLITIEMCESDYIKYTGNGADYKVVNADKFRADILRSYKTAVLLCANICKRYGWNPESKLSNGMFLISSHNEGRIAGLSSAHVDPDHVWSRLGLTMAGFRKDVANAMRGQGIIIVNPTDIEWYRVRKSWTDEKSQLGAYQYLENAKDNCPRGYTVYNSKGQAVYSTPEDAPKPTPQPKPDTGTKYRVRLGVFSNSSNVSKLKKNVKKKLDLDCFTEDCPDGTHVYCGSFSTKKNAVARESTLRAAGFDTKIVTV